MRSFRTEAANPDTSGVTGGCERVMRARRGLGRKAEPLQQVGGKDHRYVVKKHLEMQIPKCRLREKDFIDMPDAPPRESIIVT